MSTLLKSVKWTSDETGDKTPSIQFKNIKAIFRLLDEVPGDFLTVTDVPPKTFAALHHTKETCRAHRRELFHYDSHTHTLFITLMTPLHERLQIDLYQTFLFSPLFKRGVNVLHHWSSMGHATRPSLEDAYAGRETAEGDSTGGPHPERDGRGAWPTLVVLSGDTKTIPQLRGDVRWWFDRSGHLVKMVLLAKFDHRRGLVVIEKWEEEESAVRPGATMTRLAATPRPVLRQEIEVRRNEKTEPASYEVKGGPLRLSVRLIFLRDLLGPEEQEMEASIPDLQWYAEKVWRML